MEKCEICNRQHFCFICVCQEKKLCGTCLTAHQSLEKNSTKGHRTVNLEHPLIGMMIDAHQDVQDSTKNTLNIPIPEQIKRLEHIRDEHFKSMNEKIDKLKKLMTVNSGFPRTKHRKSFSLTEKIEKSRGLDEIISLKSVKLVVAGDKNTGKSTLEQGFSQLFTGESSASGRLSKTFKYKQHRVSVSLSVIPSNAKVSLRNTYFFRAKGMIFLFDLTNQSSLYSLDTLVQEAKKEIQKKVHLFLIGTRFDMLEKYQRALTKEESQNISSNYSAKYFELNLKDQSSVQLFFEEVVKSICEDF